MSLAEIKDAVAGLSGDELAELTAFILAKDDPETSDENGRPGLASLQALDDLQRHLCLDPQKAGSGSRRFVRRGAEKSPLVSWSTLTRTS